MLSLGQLAFLDRGFMARAQASERIDSGEDEDGRWMVWGKHETRVLGYGAREDFRPRATSVKR